MGSERRIRPDAAVLQAGLRSGGVLPDTLHDPAGVLHDPAGILLLDGATGTELERRGVRSTLPLWSAHALLEAPDVVRAIHEDYVRAGARALTANTFRTQRRTLDRGGLGSRARELTELAVSLARTAAESGQGVRVLGSVPPLEDCYCPELVPDTAALEAEHAEHVDNLGAAGVDAILVETMNTAREAVVCARAARRAGIPALVSFVCWNGAQLLSGEALADAVEAVRPEAPAAVLVNCLPPSNVGPCLAVLGESGLPFGAYANLGAPDDETGFRSEECAPEAFAEAAAAWVAAGARIVGGCCGTRPEHVRAASERLLASPASLRER